MLHHDHALLVRSGCRTPETVGGLQGGRICDLNFLIVRTQQRIVQVLVVQGQPRIKGGFVLDDAFYSDVKAIIPTQGKRDLISIPEFFNEASKLAEASLPLRWLVLLDFRRLPLVYEILEGRCEGAPKDLLPMRNI